MFEEYYAQQAGSGLSGFTGNRYQHGNGFFGKVLKSLKPALKYVGRHGWDAIKLMGRDVMSGQPLEKAGTNALLTTTQTILDDAKEKLESMKKQTGRGRKVGRPRKTAKKASKKVYKRKTKTTKTKKTKKKTVKGNSFF